MAPIGEAYFPPLDRCFSGEHQLLSWKSTYVALAQLGEESDNGSLKQHLTDPQTIELLARSFSPYSAPTSQTKSSFETKTSAINVTPSAHARYDIKQIQEDTLWLSKETKIDEVSALRIAVLEWQTRSAALLLRGSPGDQVTSSKGGRGAIQFQTSFFDPGSSLLAKSSLLGDGGPSFEDDGARRQRLLETYLSERRYILKISEYITFAALCRTDEGFDKAADQGQDRSVWLEVVGGSILSAWSLEESPKGTHKSVVVDAVEALRARFEALEKGSGWLQGEGVQEEIEFAWARNQLVEAIHIMRIVLNILESSSKIMKAPVILSWFRLMNESGFFESVQLPLPTLQGQFDIPLQSLAALVSLAILQPWKALDLLVQSSTAAASTTNPAEVGPYILDSAAVNEINDILIDVAPLRIPSPAVLAWGIIMQTLRETALTTRESREVRQSLRAADRYGAADSSDTDGGDRPSRTSLASLRRRSSTGSDTSQQSTLLEEIYDTVAIAGIDGDPILYLANNAVGGNKVFDFMEAVSVQYCTPYGFEHGGKPGQRMRALLLELIRASLGSIEYTPALIKTTIAVITGSERYWDTLDRPIDLKRTAPTATFLRDSVLRPQLFLQAAARFPYESQPFLNFCRALAFDNNGRDGMEHAILSILDGLDTFTCSMPAEFLAYRNVRTQEESDHIELTDVLKFTIGPPTEKSMALSLRPNKRPQTSAKNNQSVRSHEIPSGTQGEIQNDSKPFIVAWNQEHSGLNYIGKVLQCASNVDDLHKKFSDSTFSLDIVGDITSLITSMLSSVVRESSLGQISNDTIELAQTILGSASDGLDRNQDIVSVIFDIFERELFRNRKTSEDIEYVEILVQCIHFTYALLPLMPDRVWPFLGRSGLLGIGRDESQLTAVVATQELVLGRYDFLLGCIRLYDALIEDAVVHVVYRKIPTKAVARFGNVNLLGAGTSQTAMERVLLSFTRMMIEVFESTMNWKFLERLDRMEINSWLCSIFNRVVGYCFDVNDTPDLSQKLTRTLAPSAEYIIDVFLSSSSNDVTVLPFLHILGEGITTPTTTLPTRHVQYWTAQVKEVLSLASTLIRVNLLLQLPPSYLEDQMFKAASVLAKVYAAHESYRLPVVDLFDALVRSAAATGQQPPSLLGHLGQETANHFLDVLSMLDQPLNNDALSSAIWRLLSAVVSKRQQWLAIFVLTGSTPRDTFKDRTDAAVLSSRRSEPLLNIALDALANIDKLEPRKALSMLEFVALAADFWPWVLTTMELHSHFLKAISEYGAHIGSMTATSRDKSYKTSADYNSVQIASLVADILSMYTQYTQQMGNRQFSKNLVPHLTYLIKNAISTPSYNTSLHGNLRQNFEVKFPGCSLSDFKRTTIRKPLLGDAFYYDLDLANKMLAYDPAWVGKKGQGFAEELKRANFNLSIVESQVNLFHSWKSLLVELSGPLASEPKFQRIMAVAVTDCLKANAENKLPEAIFERLAQSRADLAFTLLQRLLEIKSTETEVKNILPVAWNALRMHNSNLGSALDGGNADYHRMLLKILYLALQVHTSTDPTSTGDVESLRADGASAPKWSSTPTQIIQIALEILTTIVAQGFRSLTIILHDSPTLVHPSDFSLITAILRSVLHIPDISRNTTHLLTSFADSQTARCASTLLSWSDQLATSGDPVYGELSILFLLETSSVPSLAESLAVEGVLTHILSTNLIRLLQSRAFGPFDQPARMYSIWARGLLPLLLNLLHAVGAPLAAEIAAALNNFPHQLSRASNVFASNPRASTNDPNAEYITITMASEAVNLALVTTILHSFREAGGSAGVIASQMEEVKWDRAQVKEDTEGWLSRRGGLRDRIVPTSEREEAWSKAKPLKADVSCENRLEEKVVEEMRSVVGILDSQSGAY